MINETQTKFLNLKSRSDLKKLGQFFTDHDIAKYMASMMSKIKPKSCLKILDAGAGEGILTEALVTYCKIIGIKHIKAVLYENDISIFQQLQSNMERLKESASSNNIELQYQIIKEDFVLSRPDKLKERFHIASINPPYFKYNKTSPYFEATKDIYKGNPNIYASFMAIVAECLEKNGQMIVIVPRSFTSGYYFKGFRQYLTKNMSLECVHVFNSRNKVFKKTSVLQENIICKFEKKIQSNQIEIRSSNDSSDMSNFKEHNYPVNLIIDTSSNNNLIRIPESSIDAKILKTVEAWPSTFKNGGYFISTGQVVEHRTRSYITPTISENSIPLLRMHNIKAFNVVWTGKHKKDVSFILKSGFEKYVNNNKCYVLLKRFSSKEEKRRLTAGISLPNCLSSKFVGFENHINFIGASGREFIEHEAFGLAALFNSTFVDKYFRCVSGNTQVNATEIELLRIPPQKEIIKIGELVSKIQNTSQTAIDEIISTVLGVGICN